MQQNDVFSSHATKEARIAAYKKSLQEAQKTSEEALGHGQRAIDGLASQEEILRDAEDALESNEYTIDKTMKVLRGMTWSGMLYNAFNSQPPVEGVKGKQGLSSGASGGGGASSAGYSGDNNNQHAANHSQLMQGSSNNNNNSCSSSSSGPNARTFNDEPEVQSLARNVDALLGMSHTIGDQLDTQHGTINRIEDKTERVHDKTLAVTLKSSQLTQGGHKKHGQPGKLLGTYQFVEAGTAKYLSVRDEDIVLVGDADRSTYFNCFLKSGNLIGIQNAKTLKYIGVTMLGAIQCSGHYFGSYEECYIDLDGRPSGIIVLNTNWGGGGWLKQPRQAGVQARLEAEGGGEGGAGMVFPLNAVTSAIADKTKMVVLHALQSSPGEIDWVKDVRTDAAAAGMPDEGGK